MEWTDTLMLDSSPASSTLSKPGHVMDYTSATALHGITLLTANATSRQEIAAALKLLRDFRTTGRRVVLCDTAKLVVGKQFGHELVKNGAVQLLISCGLSGREVGIGARDAGLNLASVVVCGQPLAGAQVLANQLAPGDTVLLLGIDSLVCEDVAALITQRLKKGAKVAA